LSETRKPGRPKGALNKATAAVKEVAGEYGPEAISTLAEIMRSPEHPAAARVSAANGLLDRAYGKPTQALEVDAKVAATINEIRRTIVRA
jgi:hypothetical protein